MIDDGFGNDSDYSFSMGGENSSESASKLREAINAIDVTNSLTAPLKRAIDDLLGVAAKVVGSEEASVLVRDGKYHRIKRVRFARSEERAA